MPVKKNAEKRRTVNREATQRGAQRHGGGSNYLKLPDGTNFFKPKKGKKNLIRIVPFVVSSTSNPYKCSPGDLFFKRLIYVHREIGAQNQQVLCPLKNFGHPCPICQERARLERSGESDKDVLKALRPKERELFNIIDLNDTERGVQLWEIATFNFGDLLNKEILEDESLAGFADPDGGFNLLIRFAEATVPGISQAFLKAERIDFEDADDLDDELIDQALDLDKILVEVPFDELNALFMDLDGPSDEVHEADVDDGPTATEDEPEPEPEPPPRRRTRQSEPEPEPEPEPPPQEDDLVYQDCKACGGSGKNTRGKTCPICKGSGQCEKEEEEDDTPPEPEPEPEPPPRRRTRQPEPESEPEAEPEADGEKKCPDTGVFGKDAGKLDACEDCPLWEECEDKKAETIRANRKARAARK